jgi:hypothetical protein
MPIPSSGIPAAIRDGMSALAKSRVWIPDDFADLGPRTAVNQALHRLVVPLIRRGCMVRRPLDVPVYASEILLILAVEDYSRGAARLHS